MVAILERSSPSETPWRGRNIFLPLGSPDIAPATPGTLCIEADGWCVGSPSFNFEVIGAPTPTEIQAFFVPPGARTRLQDADCPPYMVEGAELWLGEPAHPCGAIYFDVGGDVDGVSPANRITIYPATDAGGNILSTYQDIVDAINTGNDPAGRDRWVADHSFPDSAVIPNLVPADAATSGGAGLLAIFSKCDTPGGALALGQTMGTRLALLTTPLVLQPPQVYIAGQICNLDWTGDSQGWSGAVWLPNVLGSDTDEYYGVLRVVYLGEFIRAGDTIVEIIDALGILHEFNLAVSIPPP